MLGVKRIQSLTSTSHKWKEGKGSGRERRIANFHPVGFQGCAFIVSAAESKEKWNLIFLISALLAICYCTSKYYFTILTGGSLCLIFSFAFSAVSHENVAPSKSESFITALEWALFRYASTHLKLRFDWMNLKSRRFCI